MAQINANPERLREFAQQLKNFAEFIDSNVLDIHYKLGKLGETWEDQEFEEFVSEFSKAKLILEAFADESRATAPLLEKDAQAMEEYLGIKPR